ncbi:MAG: hypothetical protein V3V14_07860 [Saprospiraceae bacterium]
MKFILIILASIIIIFIDTSCSSIHNIESNNLDYGTKEKIILDTDMGSDCDDVGALALLHEYINQGKIELLGVIYSSGAIPYGVGVIDAINTYYNRGKIPIGSTIDTTIGDPKDKMNAKMLAYNTSLFNHQYITNHDVLNQTVLNRKLLAAQEDTSVTYITIGHTKGLYELLVSKADSISPMTGKELVNKKIKRWVALGGLRASNKEGYYSKDWNFFFNGTVIYTKYLIENFNRPIYFVDGGSNVMTGKSLINTPKDNIVRKSYEIWLENIEQKKLEDQRPSWDIVTVFYAVEGLGSYFKMLANGYLNFDIEKGCKWLYSDKSSNHHFIKQLDDKEFDFANYLNRMIIKK